MSAGLGKRGELKLGRWRLAVAQNNTTAQYLHLGDVRKMREELAKKRFGKLWNKMLDAMEGNTVGVLEDGTIDYYDYDIEDAYKQVTKGQIKKDWD